MKRRMLDSGIWANEKFAALPCMARLLQVGLITLADDQGRVKAHPAYLRSQLFPYDEDVTVADVRKWLQAICANSTATTYAVDGKEYVQLLKWWDYQSLQYASPSEYPRPEGWQDRIRYNAKGNMTLTCNWITTSGDLLTDTCDQNGNPLPIVATLPPRNPGGRPPKNPSKNPGGNLPKNPGGNVNKDQIEVKDQIEDQEAEGAALSTATAIDPDVARVWEAWNANMPGIRTPVITDGVNALLNDYSAAEIVEAIAIACRRHKRSLGYIEGILAKGVFSKAPVVTGGDYRPARTLNRGLAAATAYMEKKGMINGRN